MPLLYFHSWITDAEVEAAARAMLVDDGPDGDACFSRSPTPAPHLIGYVCCLTVGHDGAHVAGDAFGNLSAVWIDD